jgi:hypothetical protein
MLQDLVNVPVAACAVNANFYVLAIGMCLMKFTKLFYASMMSAAMILPQMASADSQLSYGGSGTTATANLDFTVIIQDYVYLRIGTDAAQDRVEWDLSGQPVGVGAPLSATGGDLDGADGDLAVEVYSNAPTVSLSVAAFTLVDGAKPAIPDTEIAVSNGSGTGNITPPSSGTPTVLNTSGGAPILDTWTYEYNDLVAYEPGTYLGTAIYTVTTP